MKTPTARELQKMLETMQALGFKIEPPSTEVDQGKQEASMNKLGFAKSHVKKVKSPEPEKALHGTLVTQHYVGQKRYGPGNFMLPLKEVALFNELLHQDKIAQQSYLETLNPIQRYYVIQAVPHNPRYIQKKEVTAQQFDTVDTPAVNVGKHEAAGWIG